MCMPRLWLTTGLSGMVRRLPCVVVCVILLVVRRATRLYLSRLLRLSVRCLMWWQLVMKKKVV